jgi:hypothetical protein
MKVFISWSGDQSKAVAIALRDWLQNVIQKVEPWVSSADIGAGKRWNRELSNQLGETKFGIICVTRENHDAPWLNFEAGAIAKTVDDETHACPYLVGIEPSDLPEGPLTQFQAKRSNRKETYDLVCSINNCLANEGLKEIQLEKIFNIWWPFLEEQLKKIPAQESIRPEERPTDDMIREILEIVRELFLRKGDVYVTQAWEKPFAIKLGSEPVTIVPSSSYMAMSGPSPSLSLSSSSSRSPSSSSSPSPSPSPSPGPDNSD